MVEIFLRLSSLLNSEVQNIELGYTHGVVAF